MALDVGGATHGGELLTTERKCGAPQSPAMQHMVEPADKPLPPFIVGVAVVVVFCLHNFWNCWLFLNVSSDVSAAEKLIGVGEAEIGLINTVGLISISCSLPVAMLCKWRRPLLWVSAALNLCGPVMRYFAAKNRNYELMVSSLVANGLSFGILCTWPPLLATAFFRESRWAFVISVTSLSNTAGGAAAALFMPMFTHGTAQGLMATLEWQLYISCGLLALTAIWLCIPRLDDGVRMRIRDEIAVCAKFPVAAQCCVFAAILGVGVALQNMNSDLLEGAGFSPKQAGDGNFAYQVGAAVFGMGVSGVVTTRLRLKRLLLWLHWISAFSCGAIFLLCWWANTRGVNALTTWAMLGLETIQGASLFSLLPFVLQEAVYTAEPATENFVAGLVLFVGMPLSAAINQAAAMLSSMSATALIFCVTFAETVCFLMYERRFPSARVCQLERASCAVSHFERIGCA